MLSSDYFVSLTSELNALKNRVRTFIENSHWQTDGEWKESVLRAFLRRNLPDSIKIGRGFVITEKKISKQIDILIYDGTKPVLFQDGDLVFLTPDAVLGVIEVKTSLNLSSFNKAIKKLTANIKIIETGYPIKRVYGLFSYENETNNIDDILRGLKNAAGGSLRRVIHITSLGKSRFIRYWNIDPEGKRLVDRWHAYELSAKAQGYFIHNIIEKICPFSVSQHSKLWYPAEGKEDYKIGEISLR